MRFKGQGHNNGDVNTTLTACIIDILPVRTNSWMNLSLRYLSIIVIMPPF
jgi:hypothetical protein